MAMDATSRSGEERRGRDETPRVRGASHNRQPTDIERFSQSSHRFITLISKCPFYFKLMTLWRFHVVKGVGEREEKRSPCTVKIEEQNRRAEETGAQMGILM